MSVVKVAAVERSENYRSLERLIPLELYVAVGIVDGNGTKRNRLVFRAKGTKEFFFLFPEGTEDNMRKAANWLQALLENAVINASNVTLPDDSITDVPTGNPL